MPENSEFKNISTEEKLNNSFLLFKKKLCLSNELIQKYNDTVMENEKIKKELNAVKTELDKMTANNNSTMSKNIELQIHNNKIKTEMELLQKTVENNNIKLEADMKYIQQLTNNKEVLEMKLEETKTEYTLEKSIYHDKIKELTKKNKVEKKKGLVEVGVQTDKNYCTTATNTEPDKETATKIEYENKYIMTDTNDLKFSYCETCSYQIDLTKCGVCQIREMTENTIIPPIPPPLDSDDDIVNVRGDNCCVDVGDDNVDNYDCNDSDNYGKIHKIDDPVTTLQQQLLHLQEKVENLEKQTKKIKKGKKSAYCQSSRNKHDSQCTLMNSEHSAFLSEFCSNLFQSFSHEYEKIKIRKRKSSTKIRTNLTKRLKLLNQSKWRESPVSDFEHNTELQEYSQSNNDCLVLPKGSDSLKCTFLDKSNGLYENIPLIEQTSENFESHFDAKLIKDKNCVSTPKKICKLDGINSSQYLEKFDKLNKNVEEETVTKDIQKVTSDENILTSKNEDNKDERDLKEPLPENNGNVKSFQMKESLTLSQQNDNMNCFESDKNINIIENNTYKGAHETGQDSYLFGNFKSISSSEELENKVSNDENMNSSNNLPTQIISEIEPEQSEELISEIPAGVNVPQSNEITRETEQSKRFNDDICMEEDLAQDNTETNDEAMTVNKSVPIHTVSRATEFVEELNSNYLEKKSPEKIDSRNCDTIQEIAETLETSAENRLQRNEINLGENFNDISKLSNADKKEQLLNDLFYSDTDSDDMPISKKNFEQVNKNYLDTFENSCSTESDLDSPKSPDGEETVPLPTEKIIHNVYPVLDAPNEADNNININDKINETNSSDSKIKPHDEEIDTKTLYNINKKAILRKSFINFQKRFSNGEIGQYFDEIPNDNEKIQSIAGTTDKIHEAENDNQITSTELTPPSESPESDTKRVPKINKVINKQKSIMSKLRKLKKSEIIPNIKTRKDSMDCFSNKKVSPGKERTVPEENKKLKSIVLPEVKDYSQPKKQRIAHTSLNNENKSSEETSRSSRPHISILSVENVSNNSKISRISRMQKKLLSEKSVEITGTNTPEILNVENKPILEKPKEIDVNTSKITSVKKEKKPLSTVSREIDTNAATNPDILTSLMKDIEESCKNLPKPKEKANLRKMLAPKKLDPVEVVMQSSTKEISNNVNVEENNKTVDFKKVSPNLTLTTNSEKLNETSTPTSKYAIDQNKEKSIYLNENSVKKKPIMKPSVEKNEEVCQQIEHRKLAEPFDCHDNEDMVNKESFGIIEQNIKQLRSKKVLLNFKNNTKVYTNGIPTSMKKVFPNPSLEKGDVPSIYWMLNNYFIDEFKIPRGLRKRAPVEFRKIKFAEGQIKKLINDADWSMETHNDVIKQISEHCTSDHAITAIINYMCESVLGNNEKVDTTYSPPAPIMTRTQQKIVTLITGLEHHYPNIFKETQAAIEFKLFRLIAAPNNDQIETLACLFVVLARIKKDRAKVRMFCIDALYCYNLKAIVVIYTALRNWPEVLPIYGTIDDKLAVCVMLIIMNTKDTFGSYKKLKILKRLITTYYKYPIEGIEVLNFVEQCLMELISKPNMLTTLNTILILLSKKEGPVWAYNQVVQRLMQMIINKAHPSIFAAFDLLGNLLRSFPVADEDKKVNDIMEQLCDLLDAAEGSHEEQESIARALLCISRHDFFKVAKSILKWKPTAKLRPDTIEKLEVMFHSQPVNRWEWFITNNYTPPPQKRTRKISKI